MHTDSIKQSLPRRRILRTAGLQLALPPMLSLVNQPADASERATARRRGDGDRPPKRFIGICESLGLHAPHFFPKSTGRQYESTRYLERLKNHRDDLTIFSGLSHADVSGGHSAEKSFLGGTRPRFAFVSPFHLA